MQIARYSKLTNLNDFGCLIHVFCIIEVFINFIIKVSRKKIAIGYNLPSGCISNRFNEEENRND